MFVFPFSNQSKTHTKLHKINCTRLQKNSVRNLCLLSFSSLWTFFYFRDPFFIAFASVKFYYVLCIWSNVFSVFQNEHSIFQRIQINVDVATEIYRVILHTMISCCSITMRVFRRQIRGQRSLLSLALVIKCTSARADAVQQLYSLQSKPSLLLKCSIFQVVFFHVSVGSFQWLIYCQY